MTTSSNQHEGKAAERHRSKSERFCASDANVTFVSRDEVLFMVHRKNLDTHAEGFAPTGVATPPLGEAVALPEASAVLDLLFQYMYPQPQPDLTKVEFSILAQLSEAAEKYQVYSAMEICKFHMQAAALKHPLRVLNYAVKHGYHDIANKAAPATIPISLKVIGTGMSPASLGAWVQYYEKWVKALDASCTQAWIIRHHSAAIGGCSGSQCNTWMSTRQQILCNLGSTPGSLCNLSLVFTPSMTSSCCTTSVESLRRYIQQQVRAIPKFSGFL